MRDQYAELKFAYRLFDTDGVHQVPLMLKDSMTLCFSFDPFITFAENRTTIDDG